MNRLASSPDGGATRGIPDAADWLSAFARHVEEHRPEYIGLAGRWIRRLGVDPIGLAPEGAVNRTWVVLQERLAGSRPGPIPAPSEWDRVFIPAIIRVLKDERRHQQALKRGRSRAVSLSGLVASGFDAAAPEAARPDERVAGAEQARWLLGLLGHQDRSLRAIAVMRMKAYTNEEIAGLLGMSPATVERRMQRIRGILEPYRAGYA